jgi:peroxin-2
MNLANVEPQQSSWSLSFEPELILIIQSVLYKFSIWDVGATYGARLQGLRYARSKEGNTLTRACDLPTHHLSLIRVTASGLSRQRVYIHAFFTIIAPYLHSRLRAYALSRSWPDAPTIRFRRKAWDCLIRAESLHNVSVAANFVVFLVQGR